MLIILSSRYLSLRHWLSSCVYDQNTWFDTLISIIGDVYLHITACCGKKCKGMFIYSAVSSLLDRSKRFTRMCCNLTQKTSGHRTRTTSRIDDSFASNQLKGPL